MKGEETCVACMRGVEVKTRAAWTQEVTNQGAHPAAVTSSEVRAGLRTSEQIKHVRTLAHTLSRLRRLYCWVLSNIWKTKNNFILFQNTVRAGTVPNSFQQWWGKKNGAIILVSTHVVCLTEFQQITFNDFLRDQYSMINWNLIPECHDGLSYKNLVNYITLLASQNSTAVSAFQ